jgi:hypothetical protein
MQELGLPTLAAEFTKSVPETSTAKNGSKKTHSEDSGSDSSEYLLDNDDQGDSEDDDDTESDELPEPKYLRSLFYHPSSACGIVALHISVFNLLFNIWSCFYIHVLCFVPKIKYQMT